MLRIEVPVLVKPTSAVFLGIYQGILRNCPGTANGKLAKLAQNEN